MKSFALGLLFFIVGIGLCVSSLAVLIEASAVRITLHRHALSANATSQVNGFVEYRFLGVPIYWMTLHDVKAVEIRELASKDGTSGVESRRKKKLERLAFLDSRQKIIAWGERDSLVSAMGSLQTFLHSEEVEFVYIEKRVGHPWDLFKDKVIKSLFAATLIVGGIVCLWGGVRQLSKCISFRKKPEPLAG
jgi:hypothetical protein